jgi:hypothetical protein
VFALDEIYNAKRHLHCGAYLFRGQARQAFHFPYHIVIFLHQSFQRAHMLNNADYVIWITSSLGQFAYV